MMKGATGGCPAGDEMIVLTADEDAGAFVLVYSTYTP